MYAYCNNNPVIHRDSAGNVVDVVFDAVSLAFSVVDVATNPYDPVAWFGLLGDVVDVVVPFVSGVGETVKTIGYLNKAADIVDDAHDAVKAANNAVDAAATAQKGWKVGDNITNLTSAGRIPSWSTVRSRYWKNQAHYKTNSILYDSSITKNMERMAKGRAPIGYDGNPVNLHHVQGKGKDLFDFVQMSQTAHQAFHKINGYNHFISIRQICLN